MHTHLQLKGIIIINHAVHSSAKGQYTRAQENANASTRMFVKTTKYVCSVSFEYQTSNRSTVWLCKVN